MASACGTYSVHVHKPIIITLLRDAAHDTNVGFFDNYDFSKILSFFRSEPEMVNILMVISQETGKKSLNYTHFKLVNKSVVWLFGNELGKLDPKTHVFPFNDQNTERTKLVYSDSDPAWNYGNCGILHDILVLHLTGRAYITFLNQIELICILYRKIRNKLWI